MELLFGYIIIIHAGHGKGRRDYVPGEKIAMKINMNPGQGDSVAWDNSPYASPRMSFAIIRQLVSNAGVPESCITITDPSRFIGDPLYDYCHGRYPGVKFVDRSGTRGRIKSQPDMTHAIHFADNGVTFNDATYIASCFTGADYLINCASLRGHNFAGVTAGAKNHFGSIWKNYAANDGWSPWGDDPMVGLHCMPPFTNPYYYPQ